MGIDLQALQQQAIELMKRADFGEESIRVNAEIVRHLPKDDGAWTRLGRCYLEQRQFDEAVGALRTALAINPSKTIATNLLAEVRKQRALTPTAVQRASTGFSSREFALIESLTGNDLLRALRPRMEALFDTLNASSVAGRITEARRRAGQSGSKLFHANSYYPGHDRGHVYAFHNGGRWEPQFNLGWFTEPIMPSCLRMGIGFNLSQAGRDPDRIGGQEQVTALFRALSAFHREIMAQRAGAVDDRQRRLSAVRPPRACTRDASRARCRLGAVLPESCCGRVGLSRPMGVPRQGGRGEDPR